MSRSNDRVIFLPADSESLPDTIAHTDRFNVRSDSGSIYLISRNRRTNKFQCSCTGWCTKGKCKHLTKLLGIPLVNIDRQTGTPDFDIILAKSSGGKNEPLLKMPVAAAAQVVEKSGRLIDLED